MDIKGKKVNRYIGNVRQIAQQSLVRGDYEVVLASAESCGIVEYYWNQWFTDKIIEDILMATSKELLGDLSIYSRDNNTILFYDSFGTDQRGLAIIYLKALIDLGYRIVYLTKESQKDLQPTLSHAVREGDFEWVYIPQCTYVEKVRIISNTINTYKPSVAFMQLLPEDVAAIVAFNAYNGLIDRFQINLTDHAFWLGVNAFDYCLEFRNFGASITNQYRGISMDKLILMPYYPYIDKYIKFEGFNETLSGKKIIFSGGAFYKTLGDKDNRFYKIIDRFLDGDENAAFVFATNTYSKEPEFEALLEKYSGRCFVIKERKDLFQVMSRCVFYLNTFPFFGGLMTQYAVMAGKIPLTLIKDNQTLDGILDNVESLGIQFTSYEDLVEEGLRLLKDNEYRKAREQMLEGAVISEDIFKEELRSAILDHKNKFDIDMTANIDIDSFRQQYRDRFVSNDVLCDATNNKILNKFPLIVVYKCLRKIKRIIGKVN